MRLKIISVFLVAILIPTALLAYFGLLAVRSEQAIIDKSVRERYELMADVVVNGIQRTLGDMPEGLLKNSQYVESVLVGAAAVFKDQVEIFDANGKMIGGPTKSFASKDAEKTRVPVFTRPIPDLPYKIALYERYPLTFSRSEEKKKGIYPYVAIIAFAAVSILGAGVFTLWSLSREWRHAELKSEFVSALSHDLRRPLTSIRMFSEMLKDNRVDNDKKKHEYYDVINKESERLTQLANNILDFSRLEKGWKKYDFKNEDIRQIVTNTVDDFKRFILEIPRIVALKVNGGVPEAMKIDANSISQAVMNLLSNAAKFSPPDKEIKVNLINGHKEIIIEVIDQGLGIPKNEQKKIFQKFYRAPQKETEEIEGSGLGLTLVKYIAEAHHGRVKVESHSGKGSKFSLIIPW